MKHIELHVLQSFPVTCLNRDDFNSPKTAIFGGVQRARVSSQSWKREIRELAKEMSPRFQGERTRLVITPIRDALQQSGMSAEDALKGAKALGDALAKYDNETEKKTGVQKVKTLFFTSRAELQAIAQAYAHAKTTREASEPKPGRTQRAENPDKLVLKDAEKAIRDYVKAEGASALRDAADIALFGRMVASDHSLMVEGSAMFSHALSTHQVSNEPEFFAAVDDLQSQDTAGAGMTGTLEFNSATYYRFSALNLDMLADDAHLGMMTPDERRGVVRTFLQATLQAVPKARRNSMNGDTLPRYVIAIVRDFGHPVQFINAFERPVRGLGVYEESYKKLLEEEKEMNRLWALDKHQVERVSMPDVGVEELLDRVTSHVG
jgi:CRISPR system Cascade subunit CasC